MRDCPVKANRSAEATKVVQKCCSQNHAPTRQRRNEQTDDCADMDEDDPEQNGSVPLCGTPPGLFPGFIFGEIGCVKLAQFSGNGQREAQSILVSS